jgi:hypothetical protein
MTPIAYEVSLCRSAARPELIRRHAGEILRLSRDMGHGGIPVHVAVTRLAALRAQDRDWQGLLTEVGAAAEKWPFLENQGEVWYWLGRAFAGIGDEASALAALQSAWGLLHAADVPQFFEEADLPGRVCMAMAEVHWAARRPEAALDAARRAMGQTAVGAGLQAQWQEVVSGWRQALESA